MSERTPNIAPIIGPAGSLAPEYFEQLYAAKSDPWDFETSAYEMAKYAATLAALPRPRYARALELGCSIGVLTHLLAPRCDALLATDVSAFALDRARERCASQPQVRCERRELPAQFPSGTFDLILMSEIGYYLSPTDLEMLRAKIDAALTPRGHLLLVHFTGETNYPLTADAVHETFLAWPDRPWKLIQNRIKKDYRLDLLERISGERG